MIFFFCSLLSLSFFFSLCVPFHFCVAAAVNHNLFGFFIVSTSYALFLLILLLFLRFSHFSMLYHRNTQYWIILPFIFSIRLNSVYFKTELNAYGRMHLFESHVMESMRNHWFHTQAIELVALKVRLCIMLLRYIIFMKWLFSYWYDKTENDSFRKPREFDCTSFVFSLIPCESCRMVTESGVDNHIYELVINFSNDYRIDDIEEKIGIGSLTMPNNAF